MSQPLHEQFQNTIDYEPDHSQDIIDGHGEAHSDRASDRRPERTASTGNSPNPRPPSAGIELKVRVRYCFTTVFMSIPDFEDLCD